MRNLTLTAVLLAFAATAHAGKGLGFEYSLEQEREGKETSFMRGFDLSDGLRLRVKLKQPSFCYLIADDGNGRHKLAFPTPGALPDALDAGGARIPETTFVRFHNDRRVARFFLIVSNERVAELERAFASQDDLPVTLALEVRDRYQGTGDYKRKIKDDAVAISWRAAGQGPDVVVEEIALRGR